MGNRAALLINCSKEEARKIREQAERERRTISGCVLNILMRAVRLGENLIRLRAAGVAEVPFARVIERYGLNSTPSRIAPRPRTTMLLWCSKDEARRIRFVAKERETTISGFVLHTLKSSWRVAEEFRRPMARQGKTAKQGSS